MNRSDFGKTKNGGNVLLYYLKNKNGMEVVITDFGGAIVRVAVPDKQGEKRDVVLGFDCVEAYEADHDSVGVPIGRVTNRIAGGSFELNGKTYDLVKNDNGNTLHGGRDFYGKRIWEVKSVDEQSITLTLDSQDGDQGFPGNPKIELT